MPRDRPAIGPTSVEVANVSGSACDRSNGWIRKWEDAVRAAGHNPGNMAHYCQIQGCVNSSLENPGRGYHARGPQYIIGGHMYCKGKSKSINYILPICKAHNGMDDLDCRDNVCSRYLPTRETFLLPMMQAGCVEDEQAAGGGLLGRMASSSLSSIKNVNSTRARDALNHERGAFIMCSKTRCPRCRVAKGAYESFADSSDFPCYIVDEEKDRDGLFDALDRTFAANDNMFPIIIQSGGDGSYRDVTSKFIN